MEADLVGATLEEKGSNHDAQAVAMSQYLNACYAGAIISFRWMFRFTFASAIAAAHSRGTSSALFVVLCPLFGLFEVFVWALCALDAAEGRRPKTTLGFISVKAHCADGRRGRNGGGSKPPVSSGDVT